MVCLSGAGGAAPTSGGVGWCPLALATCKFKRKMADRKNNNVPNSSANLLFSAAPEFNFNLPFIPVSQASGPAVLSGGKGTCYWIIVLKSWVLTWAL